MGWLNKAQFKTLAETANTIPVGENEAGFTVSAKQGPQGELVEASDRFMVGGVPGQKGASHDAPISGRTIAGFTRSNRALLEQPEMYIGAWHEGDRPPRAQVDLDVAQGFERTAKGSKDARTATLARNERAFGEIAPDDFRTHTNQFSTRRISDKSEDSRDPPGSEYLKTLRRDPTTYAAVVGGNVLGALNQWIKRRP